MLYSLPTGKVIELSVEQYLDLTDEELEYLISINYGDAVENPFFGSILEKPNTVEYIPPSLDVVEPPSSFPIEDLDDSIEFAPEEE